MSATGPTILLAGLHGLTEPGSGHGAAAVGLKRLASGAGDGVAVDIQATPTWLLWIFAIAALGFFVAVLLRMMPPPLRRRRPGISVGLGAGVFLVATAVSRDPRASLWFGAVGFVAVSLPLLWMGKIPIDMPPASDPRVRQHPQYREVARRGRIAGLAMVALVVTEVVLSVVFVRGLST